MNVNENRTGAQLKVHPFVGALRIAVSSYLCRFSATSIFLHHIQLDFKLQQPL